MGPTNGQVVLAGPDPALLDRLAPLFWCSDTTWLVQRHIPGTDRTSLRRSIARAWEHPADVSALVVDGDLVRVDGQLSVTTAEDWSEDPAALTVGLRWLMEELHRSARQASIAILRLRTAPTAILDLPSDDELPTLIAIATETSDDVFTALIDALTGEGTTDGVVTVASLARTLRSWLVHAPPGDNSTPLLVVPSALALQTLGLPYHRVGGTDPDDFTGTVLPGRFRVDERLGSGTTGTVYRAWQYGFERAVAVKILNRSIHDSADEIRTFAREAASAGRVHHPNVVHMYHADITLGGRLFLAMQLLNGRTLAQVLQNESISPDRGLQWMRDVLAGLAAVHREGLVHADLKPGNIMIVADPSGERAVLLDFGMSVQANSVASGGTPTYMAPEQLALRVVDARADLFSFGLVLLEVLTGWSRTESTDRPPLDQLDLPSRTRTLLVRLLREEPTRRYSSALEVLNELGGLPADAPSPPVPLAPLGESDADRLVGREKLVVQLASAILFRRLTVLVSASGMGKTSVLRAGVLPRLRTLRRVYDWIDGRTTDTPTGKDILIVDQVEARLVTGRPVPLSAPFVLLAVREEFLSALLQELPPGLAAEAYIVFVQPIPADDARTSLRQTLDLVRVHADGDLLDQLTADLCGQSGRPGWQAQGVYPPHLGLACMGLRDAATNGHVSLGQYSSIGGLAGILSNHLDRVLDGGLTREAIPTARAVFSCLINDAGVAVHCAASDLPRDSADVVDVLRERGLIVPVKVDGKAGWSLAHESLGPRVRRWADARDLDRRRARELLRYHTLRSREGRPSLLSGHELREIARSPGVIDSIDAHTLGTSWTPAELVRISRRRRNWRTVRTVLAVTVGLAFLTVLLRAATGIMDASLGRVTLVFEWYDWDVKNNRPIAAPARTVDFALWQPDPTSFEGPDFPIPWWIPWSASEAQITDQSTTMTIQALSWPAWIQVFRPGCGPSWMPIERIPAYRERLGRPVEIHLYLPTCEASRADMVEVDAGPYWSNGAGDPPVRNPDFVSPEEQVDLPTFWMDRTETSNAWFEMFLRHREWTGISLEKVPDFSAVLGDPRVGDRPVVGVTWHDARAFCRYVGKDLPTSNQFEKAARGGWTLKGIKNPWPRRSVPWGLGSGWANLAGTEDGYASFAPVQAGEAGASPYGILQLAGNVWEWLREPPADASSGLRMIQGGSYMYPESSEVHTIAYTNLRLARYLDLETGFRCVEERLSPTVE